MTKIRRRGAEYAQAFRALCKNSIDEYRAGVAGETPEFLRLNDAVLDADRGVPSWRRSMIERRIVRQLDYWNQMDAIAGETDD